MDAEMTHRIQSGWKNWKRVSGIQCDRRISLRVKRKVYETCKTSNDVRCRNMGSEESTKVTKSASLAHFTKSDRHGNMWIQYKLQYKDIIIGGGV